MPFLVVTFFVLFKFFFLSVSSFFGGMTRPFNFLEGSAQPSPHYLPSLLMCRVLPLCMSHARLPSFLPICFYCPLLVLYPRGSFFCVQRSIFSSFPTFLSHFHIYLWFLPPFLFPFPSLLTALSYSTRPKISFPHGTWQGRFFFALLNPFFILCSLFYVVFCHG